MATIRKRGNLQFEARVRRRGYPTVCKTFDLKADAEAWARATETEMDKGLFTSAKEAEAYTLSECIERYIEEYLPRLKHPKVETYRANSIARRPIGKRIMATIRSKDIADYRKAREKEGVSSNTIRLEMALISRLFTFAKSDWGMESLVNPVQSGVRPKKTPGRERRLREGEEEKLLSACTVEFKPVVRFALATAMRRGEIVGLRWENVDFNKSTAFLPETKNGTARTVPLSRVAKEILQGLPRHISGLVFPYLPNLMSVEMLKTCKRAGIDGLHFHDLRHEATSRFFEQTDLDSLEISRITGHKSMQMLSRYSHLRSADLADRLDGKRRGEGRERP
jgi:integrase